MAYWNNARLSHVCTVCGKQFDRYSSQRIRFCSNACRQKAYRDRQLLKPGKA